MLKISVASVLAFLGAHAFGQGSGYFVSPQISDGRSIGSFTALQSDGKVVISNGAARLNADGSIDSTYSLRLSGVTPVYAQVAPDGDIFVSDSTGNLTDCSPSGIVKQVTFTGISGNNFLIQKDGKVIVWTSGVITIQGVSRQGMARVNPDGTLDETFDPGFGPNASISAVLLMADGEFMVGGFFSTFDKTAAEGLVRLNTNGSVDTAFTAAIDSEATTEMAQLQSGQIVAWLALNRQLVVFNADGSVSSTLGTTAGGSDQIYALTVQSDGKLILGGGFTNFAGKTAINLLRLNADGTIDSTFNPYPTLANLGSGDIVSLAVDAEGHVYFQSNSTQPYRYARLNSDGSPDLTYTPGSPVPGQVVATARSSDGRVFVAGFFTGVDGATRVGLAAIHSDGSLDTTFVPNVGIPWAGRPPSAATYQPSAQLAVLADGSVLVSGTFNSIGNLANPGVAHFLANGTLDTSFSPTFNSGDFVTAVAALPNGGWAIGGSFSSVDGSQRSNIAAFLANGSLDPAYGTLSGTNGPVTLLVQRPSGGLFVAGQFSEVGSNRNESLGALNADGSVDTTFDASSISANTTISAVAPESDGHLLVVASSATGNIIARLESSGASDLTYTFPNLVGQYFSQASVTAATVDSSGRAIVALTESSLGPTSRGFYFGPTNYNYFLLRFDAAGNLDPAFVSNGQQSNAAITSLAMGSDGLLIAAGSFPALAASSPGYNNLPGPLEEFDGSNVNGLILIANATESVTVAPTITSQPIAASAAPGSTATFDAGATGAGLSYQWELNGTPIPGATGSQLSVPGAGIANVGDYAVTVSNAAGSVTSSAASLALSGPPLIVVQPSAVSTYVGGSAALSVSATGTAPFTYQWSVGGMAIPGANSSSLVLNNIGANQGGAYAATITNALGSVTSTAASVSVATSPNGAHLSNISARAYVAPGQNAADILIAGFVTAGNQSKQVLLRGVGPTLASFNVAGYLANPELLLFAGPTLSTTVSSWDPSLAATMSSVGAFALTAGSKDAAVVKNLNPGSYTAQITSTNLDPGIALAEVYDADPDDVFAESPGNRIINLSARAYVGTGADILIGGFVISGESSETVLIRAVGPTLSTFNVAGALAKPVLTVYDSATPARVIATNSGWQTAPLSGDSGVSAGVQPATATVMSSVSAFSLPADSADSAMILTLPPGSYTAQVTGANSTTGIALVEIYEIP
jgi:uncharacterized delta-60 repeat protein